MRKVSKKPEVKIGQTVKWKSLRWGHVFQGKVLAIRRRDFGGAHPNVKMGVQIKVSSTRYHDMFNRKVTWIAFKNLIVK